MYTATELAIWPGLLRSPSVETLALGAVMVALLVVRVREEERLLVASVPGYDAYMRRTRRLVPFVF
jgi:protein-S-isoprenylcysteine O-methyltransferase Ste14